MALFESYERRIAQIEAVLRHVRMRFRLNMNISSVRESWIFIGQIELISYFLSMMLHKSKFLSKFAE